MPSNIHSRLTGSEVHSPYMQVFANNSAFLLDSTVYTSNDLYKKALVVADQKEYVLTSYSPKVWTLINGGGGGGSSSSVVYTQFSPASESVTRGVTSPFTDEFTAGGLITIPADVLTAGDRIVYRVFGNYPNLGGANIYWQFKWGGLAFGVLGGPVPDGEVFFYEFQLGVVSTDGTNLILSGMIFGDQSFTGPLPIGIGGASGITIPINTVTTALDMTLEVTVTGGASGDGLTITYTDVALVR